MKCFFFNFCQNARRMHGFSRMFEMGQKNYVPPPYKLGHPIYLSRCIFFNSHKTIIVKSAHCILNARVQPYVWNESKKLRSASI